MVIWAKDILSLRREETVDFGTIYTRFYQVNQGVLASTFDLERGDSLPTASGITGAEIIDYTLSPDKDSHTQQIIQVRAFKPDFYLNSSATNTLQELRKSKLIQIQDNQVRVTRNYECDDSTLSGTLGLSHASLPTLGTDLDFGTWTITPKVSGYDIDTSYTVKKTRLSVIYTAPLGDAD